MFKSLTTAALIGAAAATEPFSPPVSLSSLIPKVRLSDDLGKQAEKLFADGVARNPSRVNAESAPTKTRLAKPEELKKLRGQATSDKRMLKKDAYGDNADQFMMSIYYNEDCTGPMAIAHVVTLDGCEPAFHPRSGRPMSMSVKMSDDKSGPSESIRLVWYGNTHCGTGNIDMMDKISYPDYGTCDDGFKFDRFNGSPDLTDAALLFVTSGSMEMCEADKYLGYTAFFDGHCYTDEDDENLSFMPKLYGSHNGEMFDCEYTGEVVIEYFKGVSCDAGSSRGEYKYNIEDEDCHLDSELLAEDILKHRSHPAKMNYNSEICYFPSYMY